MYPECFRDDYWECTTAWGEIFIVPHSVESDPDQLETYRPESCFARTIHHIRKSGYVGRWTAPGYLDASEWIGGPLRAAVNQELRAMVAH